MINPKQWLCEVDAYDPKMPSPGWSRTTAFTRASVAYNPLTGASVASGSPRICAIGPQNAAALLEIGTTNLVVTPACNALTGWTGSNGAVLALQATSPGGSFPLGMTSCIKNTLTTNTGLTIAGYTLALNTPHTFSIWCYVPGSVAAGTAWIYVAYDNGAYNPFSNVLITERDVWVEKVVSFTSNLTVAAHVIGMGVLSGAIGNIHYCTKAQVEAWGFRSSWTTGTRANEALTFQPFYPGNAMLMTQGTVEFWFMPFAAGNWCSILVGGIGTGRQFGIFTDSLGSVHYDHGVTNASIATANGVAVPGQWTHVAVRWSTTVGTRELFINGASIGTLTYTPGTDTWPINLTIAGGSVGLYLSNMRISSIYRSNTELNKVYSHNVTAELDASTVLLLPLLVNTENYELDLGAPRTLKFCSGENYTDPVSHESYMSRITSPALYRSSIFDNEIGGVSNAGYGELRLANADGKLDALYNYSFDGRGICIKEYDNGVITPYMNCTIEQAQFSLAEVTFKLNGRQALFDKAIQTNTYGGTSTGATGIDGGAEVKGVQKPLIIGSRVDLWSPVCANPTNLVYQYNDPSVFPNIVVATPTVYNKGVAYTIIGVAYTSQADMEANQPAVGGIRFWPAGGCFRLREVPSKLTCSATTNASVPATIRELVIAILGTSGWPWGVGYPSFLSGVYVAAAGLAVTGETYSQALDSFLGIGPGWWGFDSNGVFICGDITATLAALPSTVISNTEVISVDMQDAAVPPWQLSVRYAHNYSTHSASDLVTGLTEGQMTPFKTEWRTIATSNGSLEYLHPTAKEIKFDSVMYTDSEALAYTVRMFALYTAGRRKLVVTVSLKSSLYSTVYPGSCLSIILERYSMVYGKKFLVLGRQDDARRGLLTLTLWG